MPTRWQHNVKILAIKLSTQFEFLTSAEHAVDIISARELLRQHRSKRTILTHAVSNLTAETRDSSATTNTDAVNQDV